MMRGLPCFALACALTLLTAPVLAEKTSIKANHLHALGKADMARERALLAYQSDLVSVLAPRADAMPLLAAAILARPLSNQPKANSFHSLIGRATEADEKNAAVSWIRLVDCDTKADTCPNAVALQKLQTQAPDNAAVWLLKLGVDTHQLKSDAARADLGKAAAATIYNDYAGTSLKALADSVGVLPPPKATLDPTHGAGPVGVQVTLAFSLAGTQPQPGLPVAAQLCQDAGTDASIKADCLKLGKLLEWGSSPLARSLGLHLREVLSDDTTEQAEAKHSRVNLVWQVQNFGQLLVRARDDKALDQHLLALARHGGTEMSLMLAALRENNIPIEAPANWTPHRAS